MENVTPPPDAGLNRRAFLTGAGAIIGSAFLLGPSGLTAPDALTRLARTDGPRLALGYIEGTTGARLGEVTDLLAAGGAQVTPAASLRAGDKKLHRGLARLRLDAVSPGAPTGESAQLDALVSPPPGAGDKPLPFYAWTRSAGGATSPSSAFITSVSDAPSIGLGFRIGEKDNWRESVAVLTGGSDRGLPKLREGTYLIGFDRDAWATPRTLPADGSWGSLASLAFTVSAA